MFFYYVKTITSRWSPVKAAEKPNPKGAEGHQRRPATRVVQLPEEHQELPLDRLRTLYPVKDL